jgi:hypothetical protein
MSPKKFQKKEMVIALFVLLGLNSSWHILEDSHQSEFQVRKQKTAGMAEFAATASTNDKRQRTGFGKFLDWASFSDDEPSKLVAEASEAGVANTVPVKNAGDTKTVSPDSVTVTAAEGNEKVEKTLALGKNKVKHKVTFRNIEDEGQKLILARVGDRDESATEAGACDEFCGQSWLLDGNFDPKKPESLIAFSEKLVESLKDKSNTSESKAAAAKAKEVTDDSAEVAEEEEADKDSSKKAKKKSDADDKVAKVEADKESEDEELTAEEEKAEKIAKKCEPFTKDTSYLKCMNSEIKLFVKKERDSSVRLDVVESLYENQIKEKLIDLLESDSEREHSKGIQLAKDFLRAIPQKKLAAIVKEIRAKAVERQAKKLNEELVTQINEQANVVATALNDFLIAKKSMAPDSFAKNQIFITELAKFDRLGSEFLELGRKGKDSELFARLSPLFEGSDGEVQLNNLVYNLYQGATNYKNKLYTTLSANRPIDDLIAEELVTPDFSSGRIALDTGTSGIVGSPGLGAAGSRLARDAGGLSARGSMMDGGIYSRGGVNNYLGNNNSLGLNYPNNQGGYRFGPQYSSITPVNNYRPSILSPAGSSPIYDWGSVRPDSNLGNLNYLYNSNNNNSNINRPYNGFSGNSWGNSTNNTSWGPSYQQNNYASPNCYYNSMSPLNNNCGNASAVNSGYRGSYPNGSSISGGRFGY